MVSRSTFSAFAERLSIGQNHRNGITELNPSAIKTEVLSGLTVALALVPEAVAFAFVAGFIRWWGFMRHSLLA